MMLWNFSVVLIPCIMMQPNNAICQVPKTSKKNVNNINFNLKSLKLTRFHKYITYLFVVLNHLPRSYSSSFATGDVPLQVAFPLSGLTMIGIASP